MAIKLPQGFKITSKEPIDSRIILTKAQMASMVDTLMPDSYFAVCADDNMIYVYNKQNESLEDTGKFRIVSGETATDEEVSDMLNNVFGQEGEN